MQNQTPSSPAVSRRDFVRAATATAIAPSIAGSLLAPSIVRGDSQSTADSVLRIGLIGCGGRGTGAVVQALNADKNTMLTAMGDVFVDRLDSSYSGLTQHFGDAAADRIRVDPANRFVGFDAYQRVIDSGVDVVILTTPPGFRPAHFTAAVDAGKHIFLEKPVAVDAPGIRAILAASDDAQKKNLCIVCGFCWRFGDAERAAFTQVHDGAIGDVISVHSTYHTSTLSKRPRQPEWTDMEFQLRNWWHFTWLSGDHLVEQACHSVDRMAWATGDLTPARCTALGGRAARNGPEHGNVYDHFTVIYEYDNGMRCFHTCRQIDGCPSDNTDYICGTQGVCEVNGWKPLHVVRDRSGKVIWSYDGPRRDMYQTEHDEFFTAIRGRNGTPINNGQWMARSTLMAIMGRMAAYTGQTITWDQALNSQDNLVPDELVFGPLSTPPVPVPGVTQFV
jgi:myo-inositol 2-dehydrogenase/D-chiro-inositol 1-dehydrogenase